MKGNNFLAFDRVLEDAQICADGEREYQAKGRVFTKVRKQGPRQKLQSIRKRTEIT